MTPEELYQKIKSGEKEIAMEPADFHAALMRYTQFPNLPPDPDRVVYFFGMHVIYEPSGRITLISND